MLKYKYIVDYNTHEQLRHLGVCVLALNTDVLTTAGSFPLKYHPWQPLIESPIGISVHLQRLIKYQDNANDNRGSKFKSATLSQI